MKSYLLVALFCMFMALSLTVKGTFFEIIKNVFAWGGLVFFALLLKEIWKVKVLSGKSNKWDEDP
ncbi:hypothetical protein [Candidatus Formimonas warabiya]|uniref:Uncharacterized protein n=1 Tax=Formimonas warabiya TaxID=1761012 RepID=A0A3G1KXG0_FORW1|nr:hypothetical protein [Candidatus Formimonas warabiya]ATW27059.1 hypothetical protein DCMF_21895 [Candidatus Formimonas warabiya]